MEQFRYQDNELWCEDTPLPGIAEKYGTPLYVYSKRSIIDHCRWIERAFGSIDHLSCYAVKANANRAILRVLASEGIGADAGSIGELQLAFESGFSPEKTTFSGVGKRDDEIEYALRNNILALNVESDAEITIVNEIASRLNTKARICLRVNFDIESGTHPYITTGRRHNKFGVEASRSVEILRWANQMPGIEVVGVHSHLGSQITSATTFAAAARAVAGKVAELRSVGIGIRQINFGGGFGVQYRDYVRHPYLPRESNNEESELSTARMLQTILPILESTGCTVLIQPGRSIIAHAGILLTKVLYRKSGEGKDFVIVDAGMNDLIRPSLYQSYHQIIPLTISERPHEVVDVVGPLCESGDFFAIDRSLPHVERGDVLAILCAGAYGFVLSSNYNGRPRPSEVMVEGTSSRVVRERESISSL